MDKARIFNNALLNSLKSRIRLSKHPNSQTSFNKADKNNYQHLKYGYEPDFNGRPIDKKNNYQHLKYGCEPYFNRRN